MDQKLANRIEDRKQKYIPHSVWKFVEGEGKVVMKEKQRIDNEKRKK